MNRYAAPFLMMLALFLATSCQNDAPPKEFSEIDLVGSWKGDFEKSWKISKKDFLADTIRGEDAYPKDPAEKEKIVRKEMESLVSGINYHFKDDGTFDADISGANDRGKYGLKKQGDNKYELTLKVKADSMMKDAEDKVFETIMEVTFVNQKTIEIVYNEVALVFTRQ